MLDLRQGDRGPVWWSLCCGLDATASWASAQRRPPVSRMGGKRTYSADILRILGEWPKTWAMVDADPAIVLWWSAVFGGWLGEVAERIRAYDLDGEELWRSIVYANGKDGRGGSATVPDDPVDRLAAWLIAQKGNFSGKPLTWNPMALAGEQKRRNCSWSTSSTWSGVSRVGQEVIAEDVATWQGVAGWGDVGTGFGVGSDSGMAEKVAAWQGVAGYKHVSKRGKEWGFPDTVNADAIADKLGKVPSVNGWAQFADLNTWAPDFQPGDLATIDPPYSGTTGYGEVLPRERVVELALQADAAGARVLVHEAEAVIEAPGWRAVELRMGERRKQNTWRKRGGNGTREVVTINFEPAGRHPEQTSLWTEVDE